MSQNTLHSDPDGPSVSLGEPDDWARRTYAAKILLQYTPGSSTSMHMTRINMQALADEIYAQHGISASEATAKELDGRAAWVREISAGWASDIADALAQRAEAIRNG